MEVARRRGRRRKKLLDDLKDRRGYSHSKEEALDRTMWRHRFGGGFGPVVRQNTERMNESKNTLTRNIVQGNKVVITLLCPVLTNAGLFSFSRINTFVTKKECNNSLEERLRQILSQCHLDVHIMILAASVVQGQRAGLQYPSSRVQTRPKPSDF